HDDDWQTRQALLDLAQQVNARTARHADVRHQHLWLVVIERHQHVTRVGEAAHGKFLARQCLLEHKSDGLVVVNDPDGFHAVDWLGHPEPHGLPDRTSGQRYQDLEYRASGLAFTFDGALMLLNE